MNAILNKPIESLCFHAASGDPVEIIEQSHLSYRLKNAANEMGWVARSYVTIIEPCQPSPTTAQD